MGIYSRDYIREDYGPRGGVWRDANVVKWLIIVNVAVFVLQLVWQEVPPEFAAVGLDPLSAEYGGYSVPAINRWLALDRSAVFGGQVWRLLTYEFLHDDGSVWHIFVNMYLLYIAGRKVEDYYGSREFLLFYLTAGVLSGLFSVFWFEGFGHPGWSAIGASGAVAGVFIVYALYWPRDVIYVMGVIPVQVMWLAIIDVVWDLFPMLRQIGLGDPGDGIAHSAHVGGMLFAFLYQKRDWRVAHWVPTLSWADWKRKFRIRPRTKLRVYEPRESEADFKERVDATLQKMHEQGEASLSDDERALLMEASRRFRNRPS
jgi:membrane associated rhomboid family serine protease